MAKRQIFLSIETTGMYPQHGHRIIEIGCVELINRRFTGNNFHVYINPERQIEIEATNTHCISNQHLSNKPKFQQIANNFFNYIMGAELITHGVNFNIDFINVEFAILKPSLPAVEKICTIFDTKKFARDLHPGQKNTLNALCRRYDVEISGRTLFSALLHAECLADVYLQMTKELVAPSLENDKSRHIIRRTERPLWRN